MHIDEAITLTQECLAEEGRTMGELLGYFRDRVSPVLIGDSQWEHVLECAGELPITMAAFPFGFELPLHTPNPTADFGASLASGTKSAEFFRERALSNDADEVASVITRLFKQMDVEDSALCKIVGRKLMLEFDIGSAKHAGISFPGMFLRPNERPIVGVQDQAGDVGTVVNALASSLGWEINASQLNHVKRVYLAQPEDTRLDSFGVFPSRSRAIRLAIMGFTSQRDVCGFLQNTGWPGQTSAVDSLIARFKERVNIARVGLNVDVRDNGLSPTLGLTLIVKQRYTKDSRYWLDGLTDWNPFLEALGNEEIVVQEKLAELAHWVAKPTILYAKSGRFILLRGIHHIKLVISENEFLNAKAYVFMVLSGAVVN